MTKRNHSTPLDKRSFCAGFTDGWNEASKLVVKLEPAQPEPEPGPAREPCVICQALLNIEDMNVIADGVVVREWRCDDCAGIREGVTVQQMPDGFVAGVLHKSNRHLWA